MNQKCKELKSIVVSKIKIIKDLEQKKTEQENDAIKITNNQELEKESNNFYL